MKLSRKTLESIWRQVPKDYYEIGKQKNLLQKIWHGKKWESLDKLLTDNPKTRMPADRNILDVGCASGHIAYLIKRKFPKSEVSGLDVSKTFINYAKKTYPSVKFFLHDAHNLPFQDGFFDIVICTEALEHLVDPSRVLKEIARVLKNDGYIIIEMDSGSTLFSLVWYLWKKFGPGRVWENAHLTHFNAQKLKNLILSSGFKIQEEKFFNLGMAVFYKCRKK